MHASTLIFYNEGCVEKLLSYCALTKKIIFEKVFGPILVLFIL
jgi:hypothetical protein